MSDQIELSKIVVDKDFMIRNQIDKSLVEQYKENLDAILEASPIVLFDTPNGLLLADGFHRWTAARQLNKEQISAVIHKGSVQDAFAFACLANLKHGKPLEKSERKKAICEFIKINAKLSDGVIEKLAGKVVSAETIRRYRSGLIAEGELEPQETRLGVDGKTYELPASTIVEANPFDEWFNSHVVHDDIFNVLPNDQLKYDLVIVDPPYGISNEKWDTKGGIFELLTYTRKWLNLVLQKMKPTSRIFIFWSREYLFDLKPLLNEIKNEYPLNFGGLIVWNFRNSLTIPNNRKELKITWEPLFYFYGLEAAELNRPDTELTGKKWEAIDSDVWTYAIPQSNFVNDKRVHPAQKPLDLYKHIMELTTKPNDLILDPFAGSGTTGQAAYELGREFKLIEQNPEYVESIRNRLQPIFNGAEKR